MAKQPIPRPHEEAGTGAETVPPGATRQAVDRPTTKPHGPNEDALSEPTLDNPAHGEHGDGLPKDRLEGEIVREPTREAIAHWKGPVVLEFGAAWCEHCKALRPVLHGLLGEFPSVRHVRIEDGKGKPLGRSFGVKLWPTYVFLRDGQIVRQMSRPEAGEVRKGFEAVTAEGG